MVQDTQWSGASRQAHCGGTSADVGQGPGLAPRQTKSMWCRLIASGRTFRLCAG